jgi:hypothetical protein
MAAGIFALTKRYPTLPSAFAIAIKFVEGYLERTRAKAVSAPAISCERIRLWIFLTLLNFDIKVNKVEGVSFKGNIVFHIIFKPV